MGSCCQILQHWDFWRTAFARHCVTEWLSKAETTQQCTRHLALGQQRMDVCSQKKAVCEITYVCRLHPATRRLYVCHILENATLEDLGFVFGRYGQVIDCHLGDREGLKFGFVVFATIDAAMRAVANLHSCTSSGLTPAEHPDPTKRRLVVEFRSERVGLHWTVQVKRPVVII